MKELEKTEEKLKEVLAILRERTSYLNNLERERQQALRFKELEKKVKSLKASIISCDLAKKKKDVERVELEIIKKNKEIEKIKSAINGIRTNVSNHELKINSINSTMQKSAGIEQEKLNQEIANIRAELAGLNVKIENYEEKLSETAKERVELERIVRENEISIKELQKESPSQSKKDRDIESKKKELEKIEDLRKKFYSAKSEFKSLRERLDDKNILLQTYVNESEVLLKQIAQIHGELFDKKSDSMKLNAMKISFEEKKELFEELKNKEAELGKISYTNEYEIERQEKLKEKISKMDVCPICKSKITKEHVKSIEHETNSEINALKKEIENSDRKLNEITNKKEILKQDIAQLTLEIQKRELDIVKLSNMEEKKEQIKALQEKTEVVRKEIAELEKSRKNLEKTVDENSNIEQTYERVNVEIREISLRSKETIDSEVSFKQREFERAKISLKQLVRNEDELNEELLENKKNFEEKEEILQNKKEQEEELSKKYRKLISEKDELQKKVREEEYNLMEKQNMIHIVEQEINNTSIEKARLNAEVENLETDMIDFSDSEILQGSRESLIQRLEQAKETLSKIGSVNLLSLEVYDSVKKEYDSVKEKAEIIEREKEGILRIVHEIDTKKKKTFLKTLESLNEIFSRNFANLSSKGMVSLELEDKKEPFNGGVNIIVKTGHGKYFDVTSLSGGEQTLVALSLIFAIQEFKPYAFYILDEIDAALDKRNSERLAELLKKYMQKGQYIVITHNDEIITNATNLYGVSMHEGISKVISLKV